MADRDNDLRRKYSRWAELMDREAVGDQLTGDELAFCQAFGAEHSDCVREMGLLAELAHLDVPPSAESRALVESTLARLATEPEVQDPTAERAQRSRIGRIMRAPRLWMAASAAAAAAAAAFLVVPHKRVIENHTAVAATPATRVELVYAAGEVTVDGLPAQGGSTLLRENSEIRVQRGSACIAMDPGIDMCTGENTAFRLSQIRSAWRRIDLESGKLAVQLVPQPEGFHLSVVADGVWSTAVGTAFSVEKSAENGVQTTVMHGKVRVDTNGLNEQMVTAHQRAQRKHEQTELTAVTRSDESPEWALLGPAKLWTNPVSATLELRGLPPGADVVLDGQSIGPFPLSTVIPAGRHSLQARMGDRSLGVRQFVAEVGQLSVVAFEPERNVAPTPAAPVPTAVHSAPARAVAPVAGTPVVPVPTPVAAPAVTSAASMLSEARRLMRAGQFRGAASQYEALRTSYPQSPESQTVLVSLAELQLDRLGQPSAALANVDLYLRGEHGALGEEALKVRIRALRSIGDDGRETAAIQEFLKAHPRSFEAASLARRLAELTATR